MSNALVKESVYDYMGRAAIEILPVPLDKTYDYQDNLNLNKSLDKYSAGDIDGTTNCQSTASAMDKSSGASKYYSTSNTDKSGINAYIPDAKEYPFIQTEFTPDMTGRIKRQGGAGDKHYIGSGKETKYLYSSPCQEELDRLFGTEAGDCSRYKKNTIIDPNGQISVSYVDAHGNTVATALGGSVPTNTTALQDGSSNNLSSNTTLAVDLLPTGQTGKEFEQILSNENTLVTNKEFSIADAGTVKVTYTLDCPRIAETCMGPTGCLAPVFELNLSLKDECGTEYLFNGSSQPFSDVAVGTKDQSATPCSAGNITYAETLNTSSLSAGVYQIFKSLKVNEDVLYDYVDAYLADGDCASSYSSFETEVDLSLCDDITCDNCTDEIGTFSEFTSNFFDINSSTLSGSELTYYQSLHTAALAGCAELCEDMHYCDRMHNSLERDMMPYGQYGGIEMNVATGEIEVTDVLSVYHDASSTTCELPSASFTSINVNGTTGNYTFDASWQNPCYYDGTNWKRGYYDELGNRETIIVSYDGSDYYPELVSGAIVSTNVNGDYLAYPEDLVKPEDFIGLFKGEWAKSLTCYHPEYPYYECCLTHKANTVTVGTESFDIFSYGELLASIETWQEANTLGLVSSSSAINDNDPLKRYYTTLNNQLTSKMTSFQDINTTTYKLEEAAYLAANCKPNQTAANCIAALSTPYDISDLVTNDDEWIAYRAFYMSLRQFAVEQVLENCIGSSYCFDCIGYDNTSCTAEPCSSNASAYLEKERRFKKMTDALLDEYGTTYLEEDGTPVQNYFEEYQDYINYTHSFTESEIKDYFFGIGDKLEADNALGGCECEVINDLQGLFLSLNFFDEFVSTSVTIGDYLNTDIYEDADVLDLQDYDAVLSNSDKTLTITFTLSGSVTKTMTLEFPDNDESFNWASDIVALANLQFLGYIGTKSWVSMAVMVEDNTKARTFIVEGTTDFPIDKCKETYVQVSLTGSLDDQEEVDVNYDDLVAALNTLHALENLNTFTSGNETFDISQGTYSSFDELAVMFGFAGSVKWVSGSDESIIFGPANNSLGYRMYFYDVLTGNEFFLR
jgi:hypothetical protein